MEEIKGKTYRGRPPMSESRRQAIINALQKNPNATQVAKRLGDVSKQTVLAVAKAAGVKLAKGSSPMPAIKRQEIIEALNENPNATQVAKQRGDVSVDTVSRIARSARIEIAERKTLTSEKKSVIIAALQQHPNAHRVAEQIGDISHVSVWKIARAAGIKLSGSHQRPASTLENCTAIVNLVSAGMTYRQAANAIGISPATVCTIIKEAGLDLGDRSKRKNTKADSEKPKGSFTLG